MSKRTCYILLALLVLLGATLCCSDPDACQDEYYCCRDGVCHWQPYHCNPVVEKDQGARECCIGSGCKQYRTGLQEGW